MWRKITKNYHRYSFQDRYPFDHHHKISADSPVRELQRIFDRRSRHGTGGRYFEERLPGRRSRDTELRCVELDAHRQYEQGAVLRSTQLQVKVFLTSCVRKRNAVSEKNDITEGKSARTR